MTVNVKYFAILRERTGCTEEQVQPTGTTAGNLYAQIADQHNLDFSQNLLRVVINDEFRDWETEIKDGDTVVFIPPVAGG